MSIAELTSDTTQVALVADASRGVGRAIALELADRGYAVLACGPDGRRMADMPRETAYGGLVETYVTKLDTPAKATAALAKAQSLFLRLDIIVHCGMQPHFGALEDTPDDAIARVFETNFHRPLRLVRAAIPMMRAAGGGHLLCVSSAAGRVALPLSSVLSASHHALEGMCDSLRLELKPFQIEMTLIEPGIVARQPALSAATERAITGLSPGGPYASMTAALEEAFSSLMVEAATPQQVAETVLRALSDKSPRARYPVNRRAARWLRARKMFPTKVLDRRVLKRLQLDEHD